MVPRKGPAFKGLKLLRRAVTSLDPTPPRRLDQADPHALDAAAILATWALREGSLVEIFWHAKACNRFWAARITRIEDDGFWFIFEDTTDEYGRVLFADFLVQWRFPLPTDHFTVQNTALLLANRRKMKKQAAYVTAHP